MNAAFEESFDDISSDPLPPETGIVGRPPEAQAEPRPPWSAVSLRRLLKAIREDARSALAHHAQRLGPGRNGFQ